MRLALAFAWMASMAFAEPSLEDRRAAFEQADGTKVVYEIVDVDCDGCPLKLKKAIEKKPGVNAVFVERAKGRLNIAYDAGETDTLKLTNAIDDSGFHRKVSAGAPGPLPYPN